MAVASITLDVNFQLTDLENKPLANVPVRLVLGSDQDWQSPAAGHRFVTGANGDARFSANVVVDKKWRGDSIGFTGLSMPGRTDHLMVAAELERTIENKVYRWLYVMHIYCKGGDCSTTDFDDIYTADAKGRFTKKMERARLGSEYMWKPEELGGLLLPGTGFQPSNFALDVEKKTLKLAFKRSPPPVRR